MKTKAKSLVKVIILCCIALLMFNCQNEENSPDQLRNNKIKTVTIDEAKNFLNHSKSISSKSTNSPLENLDLDKMEQEKINGSDQLLTVIPFATNSESENVRILLLKIDNKIESVVFKMYPDENSGKGSFSGKLLAYSLDGNFINGFRAKDGIIVSKFVESDTDKKTNSKSGKNSNLIYAVQLNEVVVQNNYKKTVNALDMFGVDGFFNGGFIGGDAYYSWDVGDGGSSNPVQIAVNPCDKIKALMVDPNFIVKLEELGKKTNLKQETGYSQSKNGPFSPLTALSSTSGTDRMQLILTADMLGYVHSHIDSYDSGQVNPDGDPLIRQPIKMFSPADIGVFLKLVKNAQNNNMPIAGVYGAMVSSEGNYQLRFTGDPNQININFDWNADRMTKDYIAYFKKGSTEINFLKFLNDKSYIIGIELYKINKDKTSTQKKLDTNKKIVNINC